MAKKLPRYFKSFISLKKFVLNESTFDQCQICKTKVPTSNETPKYNFRKKNITDLDNDEIQISEIKL